MKIKVVLYSTLRDKLPPENHGRIDMELSDGSTASDVVQQLNLLQPFFCAVNGEIERNMNRPIQGGDELHFFRPGAGGSSD